jgi:hypothetical protein
LIALVALVQPATRAVQTSTAVLWGIVLVFVPLALIVSAAEFGVPWLVLVGLFLFGVGAGLALRGTFALAEVMSTPQDRAGVIAAFTVAQYLGLSVPALAVGPLADIWGLASASGAVGTACAAAAALGYGKSRNLRLGRSD